LPRCRSPSDRERWCRHQWRSIPDLRDRRLTVGAILIAERHGAFANGPIRIARRNSALPLGGIVIARCDDANTYCGIVVA